MTVPTYSVDDPSALNYSPKGNYDYYFNKARGGVPEWKNEFAVMSHGPWLDFDPVSKAPAIKAPTIMVHSDGCAFPEQAKKFYSLLGGVKSIGVGRRHPFRLLRSTRAGRLCSEERRRLPSRAPVLRRWSTTRMSLPTGSAMDPDLVVSALVLPVIAACLHRHVIGQHDHCEFITRTHEPLGVTSALAAANPRP